MLDSGAGICMMRRMDAAAEAIWAWLGREIAEFGIRWLFIVIPVLGFSGWFGWRYRDMKRRVKALEDEVTVAKAKLAAPIQVNVNVGEAGTDAASAEGDDTAFDLPIRDAIYQLIETVPHSFDSSGRAERHFFQVLYQQMCTGALPVIGSREEGSPPECISAGQCRALTPQEVVVPANPSAPHGVRFDLFDMSVAPEPGVEYRPVGFSGLRIRSRDLYRIWPQ